MARRIARAFCLWISGMKKFLAPILFGLFGALILVYLGVWQTQRLQWKEARLFQISKMISAAPVDLPDFAIPKAHQYLSVKLTGELLKDEVHVLTSRPPIGPGYRVIAKFKTKNRSILIDRGFIREGDKNKDRTLGFVEVTGNLLWPNEIDEFFTPDPDLKKNLWFARDLPWMSKYLNTEPILIVAREIKPSATEVLPWPINTTGIPNNHLQYAITWFALSIIWLGMTAYWISRIKRQKDL